ncbi:hypothetical protein ADL12_04505 [Streptomyces regalis]|uniref:Uncharacterized protein n=1 Tax=Streptomyces regalis TaxID=68262 RepID=A0A0X3VKA1_9ACTN|nr:hypothetical protein [Streptomyces regalis]KUL45060.1 hypothetical protein ADL12_04505 [Streptomyces regalis]
MSIIHAFARWILGVFAPGTGKRRGDVRPTEPVPAERPAAPAAATVWPPVPRSPYGLDVPLDGRAAAMVRPYVLVSERERARQYRRRAALAADWGIDLDRHVVGAGRAA